MRTINKRFSSNSINVNCYHSVRVKFCATTIDWRETNDNWTQNESLFLSSLTPLTKYKLHQKTLQDSVNLNVASTALPAEANGKGAKRPRTESIEANVSAPAAPAPETTTAPEEKSDQEKKKKKQKKTTVTEEPVVVLPPVEAAAPVRVSESPPSQPSTAGRLREIKSKTPKWKPHQPRIKENSQRNLSSNVQSDQTLIIVLI